MRAPDFWRRGGGGAPPASILAPLLAPMGWAYGAVVKARLALAKPGKVSVPVLCVGNLVAGGAGKTPVAASIGAMLAARGVDVHFVSRGYGGAALGPLRVDPAQHGFRQVGDEPLLLARVAPTWVCRDRLAGCRAAAAAAGARVILMDDGFQNPSVAKDVSLVVVDGNYGFGNGHVMPAGPLREPVSSGLARADGVVLIGGDGAGVMETISATHPGLEVLRARMVPGPEYEALASKPVVAFAGMGYPDKFFRMVRESGCALVSAHRYADHHPYTRRDLTDLARAAANAGAVLVTTEKDAVRLPAGTETDLRVMTLALEWKDQAALDEILQTLASHGQ